MKGYTFPKGCECMKIGEFSRKYKVSIDTIRYYMELMLIVPEKAKGQYDFNEVCGSDLEEILWLKSADFSLHEIQRVFSLKRLTSLKSDEDVKYYKKLFENKRNEFMRRREEIGEIINKIDNKILSIKQKVDTNGIKLGLPLQYLNILSCPRCRKDIKLIKANVEENIIVNGKLGCSCGFEAEIVEGIILTKNDYKETYHIENDFEGHFIEQTSSEFVNFFYKSSKWMISKLNLDSKILLEPGTGSGSFVSQIITLLPSNSLYICVDHDRDLLRATKENVERNYNKGNYIFICCDFHDIPIKDGNIDMVIDHFGSSNYNFTNEGYLIDIIQEKVKKGGEWIGNYFNFKPDAKSLKQYPVNNRDYFYLKNIIESFEKSKFKAIDFKDMGYTEKGGIYEKFFIEGDKLYNFAYYGEKVE